MPDRYPVVLNLNAPEHREGLVMRVGYDSGDFTANMQRIVVEERLNLAVVRPQAILRISNLPYSGGS